MWKADDSGASSAGRAIAATIVVICFLPIIALIAVFSEQGAENFLNALVDQIMNG